MTTHHALTVDTVNFTIGGKKKAFSLRNISFSVPCGCVTGLIGENGAGKTTLMRLILNLYVQHSGTISIFGTETDREAAENRNSIGFVIDQHFLPTFHTPKSAGNLLSKLYAHWDQTHYEHYLHHFKIPFDQRISKLSSGTAQKVQIAVALAHGARLLILDEPLNYLDPIAKKQFLELLQEFMKVPEHAVLISSHQTADLEKLCDDIIFLHQGSILFHKNMEDLNAQYGLLKIDEATFRNLQQRDYIGWRKTAYAYEVLTAQKHAPQFNGMVCEDACLEDIMYFHLETGGRQ